MKIQCTREKFSHAFQLAASVAAVRDVKPVLQNVLLKVESDVVMLMATDSEIGIRILVEECEVEEPGEAILPTKLVKSILQESGDKTLQIHGDSQKTLIKGARSRFTLPTQPVSDFPEIEPFSEESYHSIEGKAYKELIKRTAFATDEDATRYALAGVHLDFGEDYLGAVATDGRRLAHQQAAAQSVNEHQPEGSAIFPTKVLNLVERSASDEQTIQIATSVNRAVFQIGQTVIYTRLIEGKFPRWRGIIPTTDGKTEVEIIAGALLSGVKQAAIVTSEKQPGVDFIFNDGKLELTASGSEVGESTIDLPIFYTGAKITLRLDPKYVADFLRVLDSEKNLKLYIAADEPVYWATDDGYEYVVMPLSG